MKNCFSLFSFFCRESKIPNVFFLHLWSFLHFFFFFFALKLSYIYRREHTRTDASDDDYKHHYCLMILRKASRGLVITYLFFSLHSELEGARSEEEVDFSIFFVSHVAFFFFFFFAGCAANATADDDEKTCQVLTLL